LKKAMATPIELLSQANGLRPTVAIANPDSAGKGVRVPETKFNANELQLSAGRLTVIPATFPKARSSQAELLPAKIQTHPCSRKPLALQPTIN
jgi:hypothetical protein